MLKSVSTDDRLRQLATNAFNDDVGFDRIIIDLLRSAGSEIPVEVQSPASPQAPPDLAYADQCWAFLRLHGLVTGERGNGALTLSGRKSLARTCNQMSDCSGSSSTDRQFVTALFRCTFEDQGKQSKL